MHQPRSRRLRAALALALVTVTVTAGVSLTTATATAVFTATTTTASSLAATATFPTYPQQVTNDGAGILHRGEEAPSAVAAPVAADSAGTSQPGTYATRTDGPSAYWNLNETTGTVAADSSGAALPGTLGTGATWNAVGKIGGALNLNGTSAGYLESTSAVRTDASFTASAWVYLTAIGGFRTVLSQDGTNISGFFLQYHNSEAKWALNMLASDAGSAVSERALSLAAPTLNTWTHLVGTYDAATKQIKLYVGGVLQNTTVRTGTNWNATGKTVVGAGLYNSARTDFFPGTIDEVRTYRRAITGTEATALFNNTTPATGMTLGLPGALQGTQQGQQADTAVGFNGTSNIYNNLTVVNPTTFTLECWFKASGTAGGGLIGFHLYSTGLTAGSSDRHLYLDTGGRLSFARFPGSAQVIRTPLAYNDGLWHHVAATLGPAGARIHVDGERVISTTNTGAQNFTGYWRFGGAWLSNYANVPANHYFTGTLDEMSVTYAQLTDDQIRWRYRANR